MSDDLNGLVWAEKYRPAKLADAILPESTKKMIREAIDNGQLPHLLLVGSAGTGKSTLARIVANETEADLMFINASLEGNIDTIRTRVVQFSSSISLSGGNKIVVLDEFDGSTTATQQSLRGVIEEFKNTRFIFTCNFPNKIIDAIHSRCTKIEFKSDKVEAGKLQTQFFKRVIGILNEEKIAFDKASVAELVKKFYPDFRRTLNELQRYSTSGSIDSGILVNQTETKFDELVTFIKDKNFGEMRKWVGTNTDIPPVEIFRTFYDRAADLMEPSCIPSVIVTLGDYTYKTSMVADTQILMAACFVELMIGAKWK